MLQGRLVAAEGDRLLRARIEALLHPLAGREILLLDRRHQQVEIIVPMALRAVADGRLGDVERDIHKALVDAGAGEHVPGLDMVALEQEDRVREQYVENRGVEKDVPRRFRLTAQ